MQTDRDAGRPVTRRRRPPFRPPPAAPRLLRTVPVAADLRRYRPATAGRDVFAGATVAALAIPAAMAYAELAGVPPVNGLYALLLPSVAYALLGSSRQLVVGPDGAIATLVAAAVIPLAAATAEATPIAAMLALLVAAFFAVARVFRLGWLADYLSRPVLIGYIHGVAIVLVISQLGKLLGIEVGNGRPLRELFEVLTRLGQANGPSAALSAATLAVLVLCRLKAPRVPATLAIVVLAIPFSKALDLAGRGVAVVGRVPAGLPHVALPSASPEVTARLVPAALAIFFLSFADEILTARAFARRHRQHVRANQELAAMGVADLLAGLTQGFPVGGSGSRTAVNDTTGARTQVSAVAAAAVVVVVLLFLTGPMQYLPKPVLAAVIVAAAIGLIDVDAWRSLVAVDRVELAIACVTAAGVVTVGVLNAVVFAIGLSIVDVVRRSARPSDAVLGWDERLGRYTDVSAHTSARTTPGVVVYRLDDRLFFANSSYVKARVLEAVRGAKDTVHWLVFDGEAMTHVDSSGIDALGELHSTLAAEGIALAFARVHARVYTRLDAAGLVDRVGRDRFYSTVHAAVAGCTAHSRRAPV